MLDKLAIIIVGEQNSGKTNTLQSYSDFYYEPVSTFKKGWRYKITPFRPKFDMIKVWGYILPASPTETNIPLSKTISSTWLPDLLLMAEQTKGKEYSSSIHFLMGHGYHIKQYDISTVIGDGVWDRWNDGDIFRRNAKLEQRKEEIAEYIRRFIKSKSSI